MIAVIVDELIEAHIKCELYLLFYGMWKGECKYVVRHDDRIVFIGACTGSLAKKTIKITKKFYTTVEYESGKGDSN